MTSKQGCSFEGCTNAAASYGLCTAHRAQQRKGKELTPLRRYVIGTAKCAFEGCDRQMRSTGYCQAHYSQARRGKELTPLEPLGEKVCEFDGCDRAVESRGMCNTHYMQMRTIGEMRPIRSGPGRPKTRSCEIPGCKKPRTERRKICREHSDALRSLGATS